MKGLVLCKGKSMYAIGSIIAGSAIKANKEHNEFMQYLDTLSPEERAKALERRKIENEQKIQQAKDEDKRQEFLEAIKPHNLWSFLGIGRK